MTFCQTPAVVKIFRNYFFQCSCLAGQSHTFKNDDAETHLGLLIGGMISKSVMMLEYLYTNGGDVLSICLSTNTSV